MNPYSKEVMQRKAMGEFTEKGQGYIRVKQFSDGKYLLNAHVRGDGGGWWTGEIAYWEPKLFVMEQWLRAKKAIENSPIMRDLEHTLWVMAARPGGLCPGATIGYSIILPVSLLQVL